MLAMHMGTGKSRVTCDLLSAWDAKRALILCPVSVMAVWRRELARWAPQIKALILDQGTCAKQRDEAEAAVLHTPTALAVVQNYESAWRKPFGEWALSQIWDVVVADESHRFGPHNTKISQFMRVMHDRARRRLCLTGTPMVRNPLSIFGQYRFLDPRLFGRRWSPFVHSFALRQNSFIPQQITGFQNLDILQERFGRIAFQVGSDVLDLPPVQHHVRSFDLPARARKLYTDLENEFCAQLDCGMVTAANALVKTLRLRQLVSGFLQADEAYVFAPIHDEKAMLLSELIGDIGEDHQIVVFADFIRDLAEIRIAAEFAGRSYGEVSGRRRDLTEDATLPPDIGVLGVQYQAGGLGVDLSRARYCIIYSPCWSLGNYDQALARVHRPGQKGPVQFYHLVAEQTVDETVYRALESKRNVIEAILGSLRRRQNDEMLVEGREKDTDVFQYGDRPVERRVEDP
jgi:SNF2 family DNA or RNA helicase